MRARGRSRGTPRRGGWASAEELLVGGAVRKVVRHGKQLAIVVDDGRALVVQLGMSGQLLVADAARPDHRHVEWSLRSAGGPRSLVLRDPRRFGGVVPHATEESLLDSWAATLGPDALDADRAPLEALRRGTRHVKAALLDQALVAGIGNIYADEALHAAGISPRRRCNRLTVDEARSLLASVRSVMRRSIARGGTSLRDHVLPTGRAGDARRLIRAYGRAGLPCLACGTPMRGAAVAGRATAWCTRCQR